ncbi:hypothetical protein GCM10027598_58170 [Amycolatopsis oliviviridis]|uniref:Uncharacterized protein n=1 Tax=Amycolatopsis oliviviridis TaxID=1471590 RepID=A0ABQ3LXJ1_9PSEU|nr:AMP-binding protein [Amycolatopsis oliviviridis]GHH28266.1 hypothetical protein GCM10017790_58820 [Amycolatopsis oliviviridis]
MSSAENGSSKDVVSHVFGQESIDDGLAVVDCSGPEIRRFGYAALKSAIFALAGRLHASGLRQDDVVAVLTENSVEFVISYYGVLAAGGVVLPLDPRATRRDWLEDIATCRARSLIVDTALWAAPPSFPQGCVYIGDLPESGAGRSWDAVTTPSTVDGAQPGGPPPGGDRTAVLMSSSGTSGKPKKVRITHRNLTAGLDQVETKHRLGLEDSVTCAGPLRHIYGMQMAMNPVLRAGGTLVIGSTRFALDGFLRMMASEKVSVAYLVPSVITGIAALPDVPGLPALRLVVSGGGPLAPAAADGCVAKLGKPLVQGFGMTEAGCVSFPPDGRPGPKGTVGQILPGTTARFIDPETGEDAAPGKPGELLLSGPQITPGYLESSAPPVRGLDGWFHTGDLAVRDEDGFLRIVGRLKTLIKYKGHQVAPAELEAILLDHPAVSDVIVTGEPDELAGEVPKAYVVMPRDVPLSDLFGHVAGRVTPHKRVRLLERVHEIPRSSTGKPTAPPALRVVLLSGLPEAGSALTTEFTTAGMSVLVVGNALRAESPGLDVFGTTRGKSSVSDVDLTAPGAGTQVAASALRELGGIDVVVDAWSFTSGNRRRDLALLHPLLGASTAGHGRLITLLSVAGEDEAHRHFVERLALEAADTGACVVGLDLGRPEAFRDRETRQAIIALATGAADHRPGHCLRPAKDSTNEQESPSARQSTATMIERNPLRPETSSLR